MSVEVPNDDGFQLHLRVVSLILGVPRKCTI